MGINCAMETYKVIMSGLIQISKTLLSYWSTTTISFVETMSTAKVQAG